MRGFIAYPLAEQFGRQLLKWQRLIKQQSSNFAPTALDNLHLTTAFLGDGVKKKQVAQLQAIIDSVNHQRQRLQLQTQNLSGFPHPAHIRSLHVKVSGPDSELLQSQVQRLRDQLQEQQIWFDDREFKPHITLGRFQHTINVDLINMKTSGKKFVLERMFLFRSELTSQGPIYRRLSS